MAGPVEVKGVHAEEAQAELAQQHTYNFTYDNRTPDAQGRFLKGPKNIREYQGFTGTTQEEAYANLVDYLAKTNQFTDYYGGGTPTSASIQRGLEEALPPVAAIGTGILTRSPALAGAARAGAYGVTQALQSVTMPERFQEETLQNLPNLAGELPMQFLEGYAGERLSQPYGAGTQAALRPLVQGKGFAPTAEQLRITGPEGPFQEGAALTGSATGKNEAAFPRLSSYIKGLFKSIDGFVADALGSRGVTERLQLRTLRNLNAQASKIVQDVTSARDPREVSRAIFEFLGHEGSASNDARLWYKGLYKAFDDQLEALAPGAGINTTSTLNFLQGPGPGGGQRLTSTATLEAEINRILEGRPATPIQRTTTFERTSERTAPGVTERTAHELTTSAGPRATRGVETTETSTTVTAQGAPGTGVGGGSTTEGTVEGITVGGPLTLQGRLQRVAPDGTMTNHIPIGEYSELHSAVRQVMRDAKDSGLSTADFNAAKALNAHMSARLETTLSNIDPALLTLHTAAEVGTAQTFQTLRKQTLMGLMQHLDDNPSEFNTFFFGHGGLDRIDDLRAALRHIDRVPITYPGGQPSRLMTGTQLWDEAIAPKLRYSLFEQAAAKTIDLGGSVVGSLENLPTVARGDKTVQELVQSGQLIGLKPGALTSLYADLGPRRFEDILGTKALTQKVLDLDKAYIQTAANDPSGSGRIFVLMLQTGGASRAANAAGTFALGAAGLGGAATAYGASSTTNLIAGLGGGTVMVLGPPLLNFLLTRPALFDQLINGVKAGPGSLIFTRTAAQLGVHAARLEAQEALRKRLPPPTPIVQPQR